MPSPENIGKAIPCAQLIKHYTMKGYEGVDV
jgi:hypothetical protein